MSKRVLTAAAAAAVALPSLAVGLAPSAAQAEELRIGVINSFSGPAAILGKAQLNGFRLGLEHEGWTKDGDTLGGVPMKMVTGDDQVKPDVALRIARRMIQSDKVHMITGLIWSHVLMTIQRPVLRAGRILLSTNAGATPMAGKLCNPLFINVSFVNDEASEAMGLLLNKEGITNTFLMAPNYQAGKDNLEGFKRTYKGEVAGTILYQINQADYQAELSRVRAAKPEAVFIFAPGAMGIAFMKQWAASGIGKDIKLYTVYTVDYLTLKPIGKAAVGTFHTNFWNPETDTPRNRKFVKDYAAKYGSMPSMFSVPAYDAAVLIADGLRAVDGKLDDLPKLAAAMREGGLRSVRGDLAFNVNGFLHQPYWERSVALNDKGEPVIKGGRQVTFKKDSYWQDCPEKQRIQ